MAAVMDANAAQANMLATAKLKRASKPRSRAGCLTCRTRHVKCDETRPSCGKCGKMSLVCEYTSQLSGTNEEIEEGAMASLEVLRYSLPFSVPGNPIDRKAIHYYHNVAASSLSGFKQSDFWLRFVMQRSETEPIVRTAVIALSHAHLEHGAEPRGLSFIAARHQLTDTTVDGTQQPHKPDQHSAVTVAYNRAIRKLRLYMQNTALPCRTIVLICAVIYYVIDTLRHDFAAAEKHAENGLAIISHWRKDLKREQECHVPEDMDRLLTMYASLDLGAAMSCRDRPPKIETVRAFEPEIYGNCSGTLLQPLRFAEAEQALSWSVNLSHGVWAFLDKYERYRKADINLVPKYVVEQKQELQSGLQLWYCATEQLKRTIVASDSRGIQRGESGSSAEQDSDLMALAVSEAQYLCGKWLLAESLQDSCDHHLCDRDAETAFALAQRFLVEIRKRRTAKDTSVLYASKVFTSFGHSLQSLMILIHRTRWPQVRARAVELVKEFEALEDLSSFRALFPDWDTPEPQSVFFLEPPTQHTRVKENNLGSSS